MEPESGLTFNTEHVAAGTPLFPSCSLAGRSATHGC